MHDNNPSNSKSVGDMPPDSFLSEWNEAPSPLVKNYDQKVGQKGIIFPFLMGRYTVLFGYPHNLSP